MHLNVSDFGDDPNNAATSFAALQAAWAISKKLILTPGVTYECTSELVSNGEDVDLVCSGAKLIQAGSDSIFALWGGYEDIVSVQSVANGTIIAVAPGSAFPAHWQDGDVIKIVSEDLMTQTTGRCGEFFVIRDIDPVGRTVTAMAPLRMTYSTSVRMGRMKEKSIRIFEPTYETPFGYINETTNPVGPVIAVREGLRPQVIRPRCRWQYNAGIYFRGAFGGVVTDINIRGGRDRDEGKGEYYSYGVSLSRSSHCRVDGGSISRVRHAVAVIASGGDGVNPDFHAYGESRGNVVHGVSASFCDAASFDAHHGAVDTVYSACHSFQSADAGFGLRGIGNKVIGGSSVEDDVGFLSFVEDIYVGISTTKQTVVSGLTISNPRKHAYRVARGATELIVDGGVVEISKTTPRTEALYKIDDGATNTSSVRIANHSLRVGKSMGNAPSIVHIDTATYTRLFIDNMNVHMDGASGLTGKPFALISDASAPPSIAMNDMTFYLDPPSGGIKSLVKGAVNPSTRIGRVDFVGGQVILEDYPGTEAGMLLGPVYLSGTSKGVGVRAP